MRIYLVRHGQHYLEESHLTDLGVKQANLLGDCLKKKEINKIYSSEKLRSLQTAEILSKKLKKPFEKKQFLNEISSRIILFPENKWGKNKNITKKQLEELKSFLKILYKDREKDKNILISGHGNINKIIIALLMGLPLDKFSIAKQFNCCIDVVKWGSKRYHKKGIKEKWGWKLIHFNLVNHIPEKLRTS